MNTAMFGDGSLRLEWTQLVGKPGLRPTLGISGRVVAKGYRLGAVILISAEVHAWELAKINNIYLGSTVPTSFAMARVRQQWAELNPRPSDEEDGPVEALLHLDAAAVEAFEELRQGRDFAVTLDTTVLLVDRGRAVAEPSSHAGPEQAAVHFNTHPTWTSQQRLAVDQHTWGQVLQQWGRGAVIPLVVPIAAGSPSPDRADIVRCLREAWQKVDGADYLGSLAASRKALELLRTLSPATSPLPPNPKDRDVDQRVRATLDALFALASASAHVDGPTKVFEPARPDAVAVVAATAALTQQIFHRLREP